MVILMFCGWEGNRRSGIALAMHHILIGLSTYMLKGQCVGDEHPTYAALPIVVVSAMSNRINVFL